MSCDIGRKILFSIQIPYAEYLLQVAATVNTNRKSTKQTVPKETHALPLMLSICKTKERLLADWLQAAQAYSATVDAVKQTSGEDREDFRTITNRAKNARLKCDTARTAFEDHCSEHSC
ncbi:MAG: hypothetical protein JWO48_1494 [Bryobacterales bacterium]|nr:hypothetical protein [Bryobacterales bacterium]